MRADIAAPRHLPTVLRMTRTTDDSTRSRTRHQPTARSLPDRAAKAGVVEDIAAFVEDTGRRPGPTAADPTERRMGIWLDHRRRAHRLDKPHKDMEQQLTDAVPGWQHTAFPIAPARVTLAHVLAYHHQHGHWPKTTRGSEHERLGTWMQSRRREARLGTIAPATATALDRADPRWRGTGAAGRPPRN